MEKVGIGLEVYCSVQRTQKKSCSGDYSVQLGRSHLLRNRPERKIPRWGGGKDVPFVGKFSTKLHTKTEESEYGERIGYFWWRHLFPICSYFEVYGVVRSTRWSLRHRLEMFVELIDRDFYKYIYNPDSASEVLY